MADNEVKRAQPVASDDAGAALHDKDQYKTVENLRDNATRKSAPKVDDVAVDESVSKESGASKKTKKRVRKESEKAGAEATKDGVGQYMSGDKAKAQMKYMLEQQAAKTINHAVSSNPLVQVADKVVTWGVNTFHNVGSFFTGIGHAVQSAGSWLLAAAGKVGSFFSGAAVATVQGVAGFLGISTTAAAVSTSAAGVSVVAASVLIAVSVASNAGIAPRDAIVDNCAEDVKKAQAMMIEGEHDAIRLDYAQKIYSVMKTYGLAEENIAGVIGNWDQESWIDPTGVETIFDEKYQIGPRKQAAMDAGFDITAIDSAYANRFPLIKLAGVGLGGFTDTWDGAMNNTKLMKFAESNHMNWYDLELQLAFVLAPLENGGFSDTFISNWEPEDNPRAAALSFAKYWEGNTTLGQEERQERAEYWFSQFASWTVDSAYANSILDMAKTTSMAASENSLGRKVRDCKDTTFADNSSIAMAAVSYAYATEEEGNYNDGTPLYRKVHEAVFPGDPWFQSCDRSVACAVRWAGADDNFPAGGCTAITDHMVASDKWQEIMWGADSSKLMPGDVLIDPGEHVILYVGNETIKTKYPNAPDNFEIVSGSIGGPPRSPGCGVLWPGYYDHYRAFRNVKAETDSKYKNIAVGVSLNGTTSAGTTGMTQSALASGMFSYPLPGRGWTTYDGHEGIDIPVASGTPIYAACAGKVSMVQTGHSNNQGSSGMASYGNCVFIDHDDGWQTRYAHLSRVIVSNGAMVKKGELIGYSGNSGNSYGAHLHLAVYKNGSPGGSSDGCFAARCWPSEKKR